jgi:hypothetical protein
MDMTPEERKKAEELIKEAEELLNEVESVR